MQIERKGSQTMPVTTMWPRIIGGLCEFCGVMDPNLPSHEQYKMCMHFSGIGEIQCSYCEQTADPVDVIKKAEIKVHQSPSNPNEVVVVCDKFRCTDAHIKRFQVNA